MSTNTVELNGKRYNAITGVFLGNSEHTQSKKAKSYAKGHHQGRSMDGFASKSSDVTTTLASKTAQNSTAANSKPARSRRRSTDGFAKAANNLIPHRLERSLTLRREAVKSPKFELKRAIKKQLPIEKHNAALHPFVPKPSVSQVDPNRLAHASKVLRSQHIKHFNPHKPQTHQPLSAPPAAAMLRQQQANLTPRVEQTEEDMFELAIAQATSHEQKAPKQRLSMKRKLANAGAIVIALLVIGSFVAYLNLPAIEVNFASKDVGFNVIMPNYQALGFTFDGPVKTSNGVVAMHFASGDSAFTLTQQASDWDNQTLADSLATQTDTMPKIIQSNDHTIYMLHTNQATWVDGGIRYSLSGNANLNTQEITAVADSL